MSDNITGLHIEPTNICTLKCSGCARTRFIDQWPQHWHNHSLDIDQLLAFLDIDLVNKKIVLCGNYGDPIYHPDLINFVSKFKLKGSHISIFTNGSYKKQDWWEQLAAILDAQDSVVFSVDGIPENFSQYRINADWNSIQTGMTVMSKSRCQTTWKYIPFNFNQQNIKQAQDLSVQLGIDHFQLEFSDRFDELTDHLKPDHEYIGIRFASQSEWKTDSVVRKIKPKCKQGDQHFISADGHYVSCCFLADHRFYYKNQFGKNKKQYSITQTTLSQILNDSKVVDFYNSLETQSGCQFNCPDVRG